MTGSSETYSSFVEWLRANHIAFEPNFSALTGGRGDAVDHGEKLSGEVPVGGEGGISDPPVGVWRGLLGAEEVGFDAVHDAGDQMHRVVHADADLREHVSKQDLLHRKASAQIGNIGFGGHQYLQKLIKSIKALFGGRV